MPPDILRVGIVGKRGLAFVAGMRSLQGVEITTFCEQDRQALQEGADKYDILQTYADYEPMLEKVDAVVVATPMPLHVPQSLLALQAGKHVLSEVTAAVSLQECWQLLDGVRTAGKTYMMAENYCYLQDNVLIKEMVRKGLFGDLYYGEGEYLHEVRALHHNSNGSRTWRYDWQVGMRGCTYGTHSLGPLMQWFTALDPRERIVSVTCLGTGSHTVPEYTHDDTTLMLCQLHSGKLLKIRVDMVSNRPHLSSYYALQGTQGVYEASRTVAGGQVWIGSNQPDENRQWRPLKNFEEHLSARWRESSEEAFKSGHGGSDFHIGREFAYALLNRRQPTIDIYSALEWTAAGLCSQISIANGGMPVQVPDFRDPVPHPVD